MLAASVWGAELEAQRHRFLHQYCESMWFPKSCWIREVFIGLAECRFLNITTDLRQGHFQLPPSCVASKFARQFVSGRAMAWCDTRRCCQTMDARRWRGRSTLSCAVSCERVQGETQLRVFLGRREDDRVDQRQRLHNAELRDAPAPSTESSRSRGVKRDDMENPAALIQRIAGARVARHTASQLLEPLVSWVVASSSTAALAWRGSHLKHRAYLHVEDPSGWLAFTPTHRAPFEASASVSWSAREEISDAPGPLLTHLAMRRFSGLTATSMRRMMDALGYSRGPKPTHEIAVVVFSAPKHSAR